MSPRQYPARAMAVLALVALCLPATVAAHEEVEELVVVGRGKNLVGVVSSASAGRVGQEEIAKVPFLRPGELLERVPGLIATQHSGGGKANQLFLRGFNLDHGTDFSAFLEGVPLNAPTHGHGQGYLDLNSLIPELVDLVEFRKGPYYSDTGDFSSAGTARIDYVDRLDAPFAQVTFGSFDFVRLVGGASAAVGGGDLLLGGEAQWYDGPWDREENLQRFNAVAKWSHGDSDHGWELFASLYAADWDATDQIPRRAVESGLIGRFGNLDDDLGGESSRYSASASWWSGRNDTTRAQFYVTYSDLDLWSNFTYFLDDPVDGDEIKQVDQRVVLGTDLSQDLQHHLGPLHLHHTFGLQVRHDFIDDVGLFRTAERQVLETIRRDSVDLTAAALYWQANAQITSWLRTYVGLRGDFYWADVDARSFAANGGDEFDAIASPKVGVALGPWHDTEIYLNYGRGFHSNDARGTTIERDPGSGAPATPVDFLVQSDGAEVGVRTTIVPGLQTTLAGWWLELDSELLFVGDAGTTEPSRASRRYGIELANFYRPLDWLTLDFDFTWTDSEFRGDSALGDEIPGAVDITIAAGASVDLDNGLFGSLRVRHFGPRPLTEDGSVDSDSTTLVNLRSGWSWADFPLGGSLDITLDVLNLFDARDDDIAYFYASRLPDEPEAGVEDVHFHPVEPRMFRGSIAWRF